MKERTLSVDVLRGLVMVIMALDHARDYFTSFRIDPTDLATTTVPLFVTRIVTHYCAPIFIFLAGVSVHLSRNTGKSPSELSGFLLKRGLWMVILELTVVRFCWLFDVDYKFIFLQVIWAIGCSMIVLALLVHFSVRVVATVGILVVALHNVFDNVHATGAFAPLWWLAHEQSRSWEPVAGHRVAIIYPIIPWVGVMALGYAAGPWIARPESERRSILLRAGIVSTVAFIVVRGINLYGDPHPWSQQKSFAFTCLSFFNVTKYPPSLDYLLMTLGPALIFLAVFDRARGGLAKVLAVYGRVPLFYYVAHIFVINAIAFAIYYARFHHGVERAAYEHRWSLPAVYAVWIAVVVALYPLCVWYGARKRRGTSALWSYL